MSRASLLAACCSVAACTCDDRGEGSFVLPRSEAEARMLIERESMRDPQRTVEIGARQIAAAVDEALANDTLAVGEAAISRKLDALAPFHSFLLFGVWHDSGEQVRIVRRVVSQARSEQAADFAVELVTAPQLFEGFEESLEARLLEDFMSSGSQASLAALRAALETRNYTAWKYRYIDDVLDLALDARATGRHVIGCDVTPDVMRALDRFEPDTRSRIREIHCTRTIARSLEDSERIAMIYGDSHVARDGLVRFLPETTTVLTIHLFGGRMGGAGIEAELGRALGVTEPVLVPVGNELALLIPDHQLGVYLDLRRESTAEAPGFTAVADRPVELWIDGTAHAVGEHGTSVPIAPGERAAAFRTADRVLIFRVEVTAGTTEIELNGNEIRTLFR